MKIKTLLTRAKKCKSDADASLLLESIENHFNGTVLGGLRIANSESYMEDGNAFVQFEMNHVISDDYITMIKPVVRDKKFSLYIVTNRMLDGMGMHSRKWETVDGSELDWSYDDNDDIQSIEDLAEFAKKNALCNHRNLIESVGVNSEAAMVAAEYSW